MNNKYWSMKSALAQIESCNFECEGGPLKNSLAWGWLTDAAKVGPEFWPGQGVYFEIEAEAAGKKLTQWVHFYIVGCHMDDGNESRVWTYDLSYDPPAPWHFGKVHFTRIRGNRLSLLSPQEREAAALAIEEEDAREAAAANGQFGVGA